MSFHDTFHIGWPSVFSSNQSAWRFVQSLTNLDFLDLISQNLFAELAKPLEWGLLFFNLLLFIFGVIEFKTFFGGILKFMSIEIFQLLDDVLINRVNHVDDFIISLLECFNKGRSSSGSSRLSSDNVDIFLSFFHSGNIFFKTDQFLSWFRCVISKEFTEF